MNELVLVIVVAAGSGSRLQSDCPKALVEIGNKPIIIHSLEALAAGGCDRAIVVIPKEEIISFQHVISKSPIPCDLVCGGAVRSDSVAAGIKSLIEKYPNVRLVLVHDAARPLVPAEVVSNVISVIKHGAKAVIPVVPVNDTIRRRVGNNSEIVDRTNLCAVQTPQGFDIDTLRRGHENIHKLGVAVTDDAAAVESLGVNVELVAGSFESIKITRQIDLDLAKNIWRQRCTE